MVIMLKVVLAELVLMVRVVPECEPPAGLQPLVVLLQPPLPLLLLPGEQLPLAPDQVQGLPRVPDSRLQMRL